MKIRRNILPVTIIVLTDEELCRMTNWSPICFADIRVCQSVYPMNTADGLYRMTIAERAVQLVINNWPSSNAKRCRIGMLEV